MKNEHPFGITLGVPAPSSNLKSQAGVVGQVEQPYRDDLPYGRYSTFKIVAVFSISNLKSQISNFRFPQTLAIFAALLYTCDRRMDPASVLLTEQPVTVEQNTTALLDDLSARIIAIRDSL